MERVAPVRSEYHDGRVVALAGASWDHNVVVGNLATALNARVGDRPCRAVSSDQKVWIPRTRRFLYPDVILVCGAPLFYEGEADVVLNPTLIVEVLSPSTEAYDRGEKFGHYRSIESLREYVLVAPTSIQVESYLRQESGFWRYAALETSASSVPISSLSIEIPISEIYRGLPSLSA